MDNLSEQCDEIEALSAIYGQDWNAENEKGTDYSMQVTSDVKLFITLVPQYPSHAPPKFEMIAPVLTIEQKRLVKEEFNTIYIENCGNPVLFQWIERLKEMLCNWKDFQETTNDFKTVIPEVQEETQHFELNVTHGPSIQDRRSVFQGHACKVKSQQDVKNFVNYLLKNRKIAQATHNISAYRIKQSNKCILQDCDDDGEAHAGGRLLHLLQIIDITDVAVVVTRWYGGIHLGPDRFRHINNAARQVLVEAGFLKS